MLIGITNWNGSVSPVFDVADELWIVDTLSGAGAKGKRALLKRTGPFEKAREIKEQGVDLLVCGAISRRFENALASAGVRVLPFMCGNIENILSDLLNGKAVDDSFLMPGAQGRRRRSRFRNRGAKDRTGGD